MKKKPTNSGQDRGGKAFHPVKSQIEHAASKVAL